MPGSRTAPRRGLGGVVCLVAMVGGPIAGAGQQRSEGVRVAEGARAPVAPPDASMFPLSGPGLRLPGSGLGATQPDGSQEADRVTSVRPALLSLALPGAGQHVLGQRREWAYAALEVAGWVLFFERRAAGADRRDRYEAFAWDTGRIQNGPRVDGGFDYYETLSHWDRSGAYDSDPGSAGTQPETDEATFNGSVWALAREIHLGGMTGVPVSDPRYQAALAYYRERAYVDAFLWDWSTTPGGRQRLEDLIEASDVRFRQATTALGVVIANHVVSSVDAYLSSRGTASPVDLRLTPGRPETPSGWTAELSIPVGPG